MSLFEKKEALRENIVMGNTAEGEMVYQLQVDRNSNRPFEVKRSLEKDGKITGISCTPLNTEINSPEVEIVEGGLNHNHVHIRLTPRGEGRWGCNIHVCATSQ
jgi:hypothetical protein